MQKKLLLIIGIAVLGSVLVYWNTYNTPEYEKLWGVIPTTKFIPLYERKVETTQELKIGLITDTHVHPNRIDRENKADDAPRYLGSDKDAHPLEIFNEQMEIYQPDMIIHAGDVIEGTNDEDFVGIMGLDLVEAELKKSGVPVYWAVGNHDLRSVTKEQFQTTLEADHVQYYFDEGDYRFVMLDGNFYRDGSTVVPGGQRHIPGALHPETFPWLEGVLDTDKHVYVIMHQAAFDLKVAQGESADMGSAIERLEQELAQTTDPEAYEELEKKIRDYNKYRTKVKASITNAQQLRDMMARYNVDAFINGHLEVARYEESDGVRYYSLTGTKKSDMFPESFYELTLRAGEPYMAMYYTDTLTGEVLSVESFESFTAPVYDPHDDAAESDDSEE